MANKLGLNGQKIQSEFTLGGAQTMNVETDLVNVLLTKSIPNWKGKDFEIVVLVLDKPSVDLNQVEINLADVPHLKGLVLKMWRLMLFLVSQIR